MAGESDPGGTASAGSRIAVIDKAVKVLDALLAAPGDGLTPTEVARDTDTNRSTAFRLLVSLEQTGLLARDPSTGRYRLGMKMLQYGSAVRLGMSIIDVAEPVLSNLRDATRQTTLLAIREGWGARCLLRLPGLEVDVLSWTSGQWLPLHAGAATLALMSTLDDVEIDHYFARSNTWQDHGHGTTPQRVRHDLDDVRRHGWALDLTTTTPGTASLAIPVRDRTGVAVCSISVSGLQNHYTGTAFEPIATRVQTAAHDIGDRLPQ